MFYLSINDFQFAILKINLKLHYIIKKGKQKLFKDTLTKYIVRANLEPEPFRHQPQGKVKNTQAIRCLLTTNCLSVFDYLIGLVLKGFSKLFMTRKLIIL